MTGELARLFVSLFGDTSHFDKNISDSQKKLQQVSKNMSAIGKKMTMFVTLPLIGIGTAALKVASDAEEMESKFNVVFGELAGEMKAWSEDFGDSIGRSTSSVMKWMAALQDTFVPLGFARDKGAEMSKVLAELTVDMASFNNETEANVIRDLQSALVGNHETVRKYGVIITQATLNQELMNMGIEGGIQEATEQEKVLARMNIILKGTADAQGDAARTADSFANRMRALKESGKDLLINIGQQLIPIISKLVEKINQTVNWFNSLDERQQKLIVTIGGVLAVAGPLLLALGKFLTILPAIKTAFITLNAVMAANPILAVVAAVAALTTAAILLIKNWDKVRLWFINAYVTIVDFFKGIISWVMEAPDWVAYLLAAFVPFIGLPMLLIKNWEAFSDGIERIVKAVVEFGIKAFDTMKIGILSAVAGMIEGVRRVVQIFKQETPELDQAVQSLNDRINGLRDHMQNVQGPSIELSDIFTNMADNADGLRKMVEGLENQNKELDEGEKELIDTTAELQGIIDEGTESIEEADETTGRYVNTLAQMNIGIREVTSSEVLSSLYEQAQALAEIESQAWILNYTYDDLNTKVAEFTASDIISQLYLQQEAWYAEGHAAQVVGDAYTSLYQAAIIMTNKIYETHGRLRKDSRMTMDEVKSTYEMLAEYMEKDFEQSFVSTMEAVWTTTAKFTTMIKETIKGLIADILRGLGRKYAALAVAFFWRPLQALKYAAAAAALFAAAGAVQRLAQGGLVVGETFAQLGEGREKEAVLPLNQNVYGELAEGIINKLSEMQTVRQPGLPLAPIPTMAARPVHLHIGTFIGDDLSLKKLERRLRDIRIVEDQRLGVGA
jgi:ABC-type transporter Mla subunit MlaD